MWDTRSRPKIETNTVKHNTFIDRSDSPCRNDYPLELKQLLKDPLEPKDLYNAALAPSLPYDPRTCESICATKYWLSKCNCIMFPEVYLYAGSPENLVVCPAENVNDPNDTCVYYNAELALPPNEYTKCKCYKRCQGYEFTIVGYDKIRHSLGKLISIYFNRNKQNNKRLCVLGSKGCTQENSEVSNSSTAIMMLFYRKIAK